MRGYMEVRGYLKRTDFDLVRNCSVEITVPHPFAKDTGHEPSSPSDHGSHANLLRPLWKMPCARLDRSRTPGAGIDKAAKTSTLS